MTCVLPLERVRIYSRRPEPAQQLAAATAERYGVDASAATSVEEALHDVARHPPDRQYDRGPGRFDHKGAFVTGSVKLGEGS